MKERHWKAISEGSGIECYPDEDFTLQKLIDLGMAPHVALCEEVGEKAQKEYHIEKSLLKMKSEWQGMKFLLPRFKDRKSTRLNSSHSSVSRMPSSA